MVNPKRSRPSRQQTHGQGDDQKDDPDSSFDRDLVKWTRVVAILTGGLIFVGLLQFGGSLLGWNAVKSTATDAKISQEISHRQLRAYVALVGVTTFPAKYADGSAGYGFAVSFHNYGTTPALGFHAWISAHYFPKVVPNALDVSKPYDVLPQIYPATLPPGANVPMQAVSVPA